jgi:hypothetical protein
MAIRGQVMTLRNGLDGRPHPWAASRLLASLTTSIKLTSLGAKWTRRHCRRGSEIVEMLLSQLEVCSRSSTPGDIHFDRKSCRSVWLGGAAIYLLAVCELFLFDVTKTRK